MGPKSLYIWLVCIGFLSLAPKGIFLGTEASNFPELPSDPFRMFQPYPIPPYMAVVSPHSGALSPFPPPLKRVPRKALAAVNYALKSPMEVIVGWASPPPHPQSSSGWNCHGSSLYCRDGYALCPERGGSCLSQGLCTCLRLLLGCMLCVCCGFVLLLLLLLCLKKQFGLVLLQAGLQTRKLCSFCQRCALGESFSLNTWRPAVAKPRQSWTRWGLEANQAVPCHPHTALLKPLHKG